jgi:hypothetical protein
MDSLVGVDHRSGQEDRRLRLFSPSTLRPDSPRPAKASTSSAVAGTIITAVRR